MDPTVCLVGRTTGPYPDRMRSKKRTMTGIGSDPGKCGTKVLSVCTCRRKIVDASRTWFARAWRARYSEDNLDGSKQTLDKREYIWRQR